MKNVVIFCVDISSTLKPLRDPYYLEAYLYLMLALQARGVNAYLATGDSTYRGAGLFSTAYTTDKKCSVEDFKKVTNVKADIVFNKSTFKGTDQLMLNPAFVSTIVGNKTETYKFFSNYQPLSFICGNATEVTEALAELPGDLVVAKTPGGTGGEFVYIGSRDEVLSKIPNQFPILIQEFMDTSVGIPGIIEGIHDIRVEMAGGKIVGCVIRTPTASGEYRANVALGGREFFIMPDKIPADLIKAALEIDHYFKGYLRHYAVDFCNTKNGFKMIEMNGQPGLTLASTGPEAKHLADGLAAYIVRSIG